MKHKTKDLPKEQISNIIESLQGNIFNDKDANSTITDFQITNSAKERIRESCKDNSNKTSEDSEMFLRIMVEIGGCAGMRYHIIIDDYLADNDLILKIKDRPYLVIDDYSMEYLKGGIVDYEETLEFAGFKVHNPNATLGCSCGSSFGCGS